MQNLIEKRIGKLNFLLIVFMLVNLLQAIYTPIHEDEAYYWVYSQDLDWGYFDHPPAVALIVKISGLLFNSILGIRFITVLLSFFVAKLVWNLIPESDRNLKNSALIYFAILISVPGYNMYSFITTPDVPLIFSFVLYLFALKRVIAKESIINAVFLGLTAAMLIYSKYHGGILIILSVIVQPKLLKSRTLYLGGLLALIFITPHLYWQYKHDFISFDYHLFQRTSGAFNIENPLGYLGSTFGILNPALMVLMLLLSFKYRRFISKDDNLYFRLFWGLLIFFFFYSFRGRIEAHWVVAAFVPMVVLLHGLLVKYNKYTKGSKYIFIISISLLLIVRVALILSPEIQKATLGKGKDYYSEIEKVVPADAKVVFFNSFQNASKYQYFFNKEAFSYNTVYYRKNQYDVENYEESFNNSKVLFKGWWNDGKLDTMRLGNGKLFRYVIIDNYTIFTKVKGNFEAFPKKLQKGEHSLSVTLHNPYDYDIDLENNDRFPLKLKLMLVNKEEKRYFVDLKYKLDKLSAKSDYEEIMSFTLGDNIPEGNYDCQIVIDYIYPQYISRKYNVEVK
ncbi:MAG: glycosyltransferase family 39 protein [Bacteroidota bacterium]